jgi:hypothetical protein
MIEVSIESDRSADPGYLRPGYSRKELAANGQQPLPTLARTIDQRCQRNHPRTAAKLPAVIKVLPVSGIGPDQHHHQWNWHGLPMESTGRDRPEAARRYAQFEDK